MPIRDHSQSISIDLLAEFFRNDASITSKAFAESLPKSRSAGEVLVSDAWTPVAPAHRVRMAAWL